MTDLVALEGPERTLAFAEALNQGGIDRLSSAGTLQARLNVPHTRLRPYRDALTAGGASSELILALQVSARTAQRMTESQPLIEVAWTYPGTARPGLRTTGGVAREVIEGSTSSLLVVGYTVTVDPRLSGLAYQTIAAIAKAAERGVTVTAVLHREANRQALLRAWLPGVPMPTVFTWPAAEDEKAALHAKLLVSDRRDALVTSANLTYHGFEGNIEMGLRVTRRAAAEIHDRIHELIASHDLVPWRE